MRRIFGFVGYACNGKTTTLKKLAKDNNYEYIDLPRIYKSLAEKNGYSGVTEWYTSVGLEKYKKESYEEVIKYIEKELPKNKDLIIDDIFDIDIYKELEKIFPEICLIGIHSYFNDRVERLGKRRNETDTKVLTDGIIKRDNMKNYCGIKEILSKCTTHIENTKDIDELYKKLNKVINKRFIICILGYSGSGKSTINKYLIKKLDIPCFSYGEYIRKIINKKGYEKSRDYITEKGTKDYIEYTNKEIKKYLKEFIKNNKVFLIDGLVSNDVFKLICKSNDVIPIVINVDEEIRKLRISKREDLNLDNSQLELYTKDNIKISNGLDIIMSKCNCKIDGNSSIDNVCNETIKQLTYKNIYY